MVHRIRHVLATLYVISSLALGGFDLSSRFCLRTLSFLAAPPSHEGPIGDTASISHVGEAGAMCEE
jgi:hypothetical protein